MNKWWLSEKSLVAIWPWIDRRIALSAFALSSSVVEKNVLLLEVRLATRCTVFIRCSMGGVYPEIPGCTPSTWSRNKYSTRNDERSSPATLSSVINPYFDLARSAALFFSSRFLFPPRHRKSYRHSRAGCTYSENISPRASRSDVVLGVGTSWHTLLSVRCRKSERAMKRS